MSTKTPVQQLHELAQGNYPSIKNIEFVNDGFGRFESGKMWKVQLTVTILIRPGLEKSEERTTLQGKALSIKAARQNVAKDMLALIWQKQQERDTFTRNEIVDKGLLIDRVEIQPRPLPATKTAEMQKELKIMLRDPYKSNLDIRELEEFMKEHFDPAEMSASRL